MNILSLFDGISCSRIALEKIGVKIDNYFSSEIDKSCIAVSKKHFPDNIFLGDVTKINLKNLPRIDLLIGGSPCQDLSLAFKGKGLEGSRSSLFFDYVKIKNILNPKFFLLENVKNKYRHLMDHEIGVNGIEINSMSFSAQSRPRCYWTNIDVSTSFSESDLLIKDILEDNVDRKYYVNSIIFKQIKNEIKLNKIDLMHPHLGINKVGVISRELLKDNERQRRVYSIFGKAPTILARSDTPKIILDDGIRKLTPVECERLQCIPDNFTEGFSNTTRYKMIGNAFTVSVIEHLLRNITKRKMVQSSLKI